MGLGSACLSLIVAAGLALLGTVQAAEPDVPYGVPEKPWPQDLGHQRAQVWVAEKADAVWVHVPWRRRDASPADRNVVVLEAATGKRVTNVVVEREDRVSADMVFQAETPGEYDIYYLPYTAEMVSWAYKVHYAPRESTADPAWRERCGLTPEREKAGEWRKLPAAEVREFQARTEFDRCDPMEVIASPEETAQLLAGHAGQPYLLFPEDRKYPIRMAEDLPLRWVRRGPTAEFHGEALRGEYYAFQVGVYASEKRIEDVAVAFGALRSEGGRAIPADGFTCFNLGGTDWLGQPLKKTFPVEQGKVGALWFGVQVPESAVPGVYRGELRVRPNGGPETPVRLELTVADHTVPESGDNELWRMSRLRWLNSTVGLDDEVVAPYTPVVVHGTTVECLGRSVRFGATGLPESIVSGGHELLARPMAFDVETAEGPAAWSGAKARVVKAAPGAATCESQAAAGPFAVSCRVKLEADGYANFSVTLKASATARVRDLRLEIPLRREIATYMMGMGRRGGYRPAEWKWVWDAGRANNAVWVGDVEAGLQCKLKGPQETWDIYNLTAGVPPTWGNGGKGGCTVSEAGETVLLRAYTGERTVQAGEELPFRFGLLVTPVKPLDPAHWKQRYYHAYVPPETAVASGANIINIHHGNELNPNINYPFLAADKLAAYVKQAHAQGVKVKIYYTVRELSNHVAELFPLRSLGTEVFTDGGGGGSAWLQEHLVSHYGAAWHQPLPDGDVDAAIGQTGLSRWHNYYLEGLAWLLKHVEIDGIYLDGIGYDREIMKRVRKVLDRTRPGCLIDFHSGNEFDYADMHISPACKYMEHLPYVNSLWFGEGYDYNSAPDYWLVEVSGIPFGLYGEMLEGNGNPWRGMVYGMTARYYSGADPKHLWKLWDDFGIADAKMVGYWSPSCPVKTDRKDVLATVYCKPGKVLVSMASWEKEPVRCRLAIDWKAVGLNPDKANLFAPAVQGFQPAALFKPADEVPVTPGRGWLLVLSEEAHQAPTGFDAYAGRKTVLEERFPGDRLGEPWKTALSAQPGTTLKVADGSLALESCANCCAFVERPLPVGVTLVDCLAYTGTDGGASWGPGLALVWPNGSCRINLRAEGRLGLDDGATQALAGFSMPKTWYHLRLRIEPDAVLGEVSDDGQFWNAIGSFPRTRFPGDPVAVRVGKMSPGAKNEDYQVLGPVGACAIKELRAFGAR